jgi:hypothetical protein
MEPVGSLQFYLRWLFNDTVSKVKLSLCLTNKHHALKMYGGVDM